MSGRVILSGLLFLVLSGCQSDMLVAAKEEVFATGVDAFIRQKRDTTEVVATLVAKVEPNGYDRGVTFKMIGDYESEGWLFVPSEATQDSTMAFIVVPENGNDSVVVKHSSSEAIAIFRSPSDAAGIAEIRVSAFKNGENDTTMTVLKIELD